MSDYYDFAQSAGLRDSARYDAALSVQPMLGQLIALRRANQEVVQGDQQIRMGDLTYAGAKRVYDRKVRDNEQFDSFSQRLSGIADEVGGDTEAYVERASKLAMSPEFAGNKDVLETLKGMSGSLEASNSFKKASRESRDINFASQFEDEERQMDVNNFYAGVAKAKSTRQREEMNLAEDDGKIMDAVSRTAAAVYDVDPVASNKLVSNAVAWREIGKNEVVRNLIKIGETLPSYSAYVTAHAYEYRHMKQVEDGMPSKDGVPTKGFRQILKEKGIDISGYMNDEDTTAKVNAFIDDVDRTNPVYGAELKKWRNTRQGDYNFQLLGEKFKTVLDFDVVSATEAERVLQMGAIQGLVNTSFAMSKMWSDGMSRKEAMIKDQEKAMKFQKDSAAIANYASLTEFREKSAESDALYAEQRAAGVTHDEMMSTIRLQLDLAKLKPSQRKEAEARIESIRKRYEAGVSGGVDRIGGE